MAIDEYVPVVPRAEWGALPPVKTEPMTHPIKRMVLTYDTGIPLCMTEEECVRAIQTLQKRHMELENADDIKYNFLVGGNACVYEGRGFHAQPCKSLGYPEFHKGDRLDIAFLGQFTGNDSLPSNVQLAAYMAANNGVIDGYVDRWYEFYEIHPQKTIEKEEVPQLQTA